MLGRATRAIDLKTHIFKDFIHFLSSYSIQISKRDFSFNVWMIGESDSIYIRDVLLALSKMIQIVFFLLKRP